MFTLTLMFALCCTHPSPLPSHRPTSSIPLLAHSRAIVSEIILSSSSPAGSPSNPKYPWFSSRIYFIASFFLCLFPLSHFSRKPVYSLKVLHTHSPLYILAYFQNNFSSFVSAVFDLIFRWTLSVVFLNNFFREFSGLSLFENVSAKFSFTNWMRLFVLGCCSTGVQGQI